MSQYFSNKILIPLFLFNLFTEALTQQSKVFKCSDQNLETLCQDENSQAVCALDDDNQYVTIKSACQACGYDDTVSYTQGPCNCQKVACPQNSTCLDGQCLNIDTMETKNLVQIARKLLSKQKHQAALPYIERIIKNRPQDSYPLYLGALATFGADKYEESLKFIKRAITIDPDLPDYYIIRGRAFASAKQHNEAEKQFQKALNMGFDDIGLVSFYQAQNLLSSKKNQEAIKKFEQALRYHPEKTSWYVRKALAHAINKQQKMAILTCKQGLKIDPNNKQIQDFMKQFEIMNEDKQKDLEDAQQRNLQVGNESKGPDPEMINKFIQEKEQQQKIQFDRKRLEQKKKRQQQENKKTKKQQL